MHMATVLVEKSIQTLKGLISPILEGGHSSEKNLRRALWVIRLRSVERQY